VLKNIVLQAAVIAQFDHLSKHGGFDLDAQWEHSITTACLAQELMRTSGQEFALGPDEFYSCGLLHDIGKVVLLDNLTKEYLGVVRIANKTGRPLFEVEEEELGFNHAAVGARVAEHWGLPDVLVNAIGRHHENMLSLVRDEPAAAVVAMANAIAHRLANTPEIESLDTVQGLPLGPLGLDGARAAQAVDGVRNRQDH
jgi:putative nucleotidyltransferase with HDIG domain